MPGHGPDADPVGIARAQGQDGERVADIAAVANALKRALAAFKAGKCLVFDVRVAPEYVRRPMVEYL